MVCAIPIPGIGGVRPGDSLAEVILAALAGNRIELAAGDILVVTHKIVSKAEGRVVALHSVRASVPARRWAKAHNLDARVVQLALDESVRVVRKRHGVLITETRHGLVCANSGVDVSNVDGGRSAVLLPLDPDRSARRLSRELESRVGFPLPAIITDTFGRPWREGQVEFAIGLAGMKGFRDFRRRRDAHGYALRVSLEAVADEMACMAGLACGKLRRVPACIIRGFEYEAGRGKARDLIRARDRDLFR
jgi:coenzyme F420-0:L-glutamate ligase / coenzyme F420-1:gamma-L-glutamate ligase